MMWGPGGPTERDSGSWSRIKQLGVVVDVENKGEVRKIARILSILSAVDSFVK